MTSASATTEPLAMQVMWAVLSSRLPAAPDQHQAIEDALAVHDSLCVRVSVGHSECEARCTRSAPVELWSVSVEEERGEGPPPLPGLFLLNAVRSYVHFSQLSAWLRPQPGGAPPPAAASYELLLQGAALTAPADASVADHAFPLAADASRASTRRRVVRVSVRHVQRERPLSPTGLCLQLGRLPTDEWLLPSPLPSPTGLGDSPLMAASPAYFEAAADAAGIIIRGSKHKASEPPLYSPTGPALKQAHFGEKEEELVIEHARGVCVREDTVVEEGRCMDTVLLVEEERKEEARPLLIEMWKEEKEEGVRMREEEREKDQGRKEGIDKKNEEEKERRDRRRAMMMMREKEQKTEGKKERRGGLRRMIGGWEESVLKGGMDERSMPLAGYTLTIVPPSTPPVRLRLATASLLDTVAACISRVTVAECERVRESVGPGRKMIRRRGLQVQEAGQIQMSLLNAEGTLLRSLTIPYDVREMPEGATTVVRHRVRLAPKNSEVSSPTAPLRYIVQMSIARDRSGRCFVAGEITVVFTTDASVDGANVKMDTVTGVGQAADLYELQAETITAPFSLKSNLAVV